MKINEEPSSPLQHSNDNFPNNYLDEDKYNVSGFIWKSSSITKLIREVLNIAKYDCNVVIQGETGVGKEKILSVIHQNSIRKDKPCIRINCATIHENLAESEFFGYEPGSFTGAQSSGKIGYFEMANGGILFLDEIGSLSLNMQTKLLRVLQENQFYRVGGTHQIDVNVRVIAANNVPLQTIIANGDFREDLYYRLNVCKINVPPLRERFDDIKCLADAFTKDCSLKYNVEKELSKGAKEALCNYPWPGNARELENIVHRLVINSEGKEITRNDVAEVLEEDSLEAQLIESQTKLNDLDSLDYHMFMEAQERRIIRYALQKGGTTRKAAELIGLPQTTFARKKLKYNL